ncbi:MAG TPA: hypothetical protein VN722_08390 [Hanamia sp.]|nr:hypothetical protein [Hanamia sp.]
MALANQIGLSNNYVSERHYYASQEKFTAGEAAKILSKKLGKKILAKELVYGYKLLNGCEPEWHHAGFYKASGKSTMGRTFFFTEENIEDCAAKWDQVSEIESEIKAEEVRKETSTVRGFYYAWDHDYSGSYGKKRNYKVLDVYEGSEANCPRNFTACDPTEFDCAKLFSGRKYYGWDEPKASEFSSEIYDEEITRVKEIELRKTAEEKKEKAIVKASVKMIKNLSEEENSILILLLKDGEWNKNEKVAKLKNKEMGEEIARLPYSTRQQILIILSECLSQEELIESAKEMFKKYSVIDLKNKIKDLKANGCDTTLFAWKQLGCIHPAPAEVAEAKKVSGLSWNQFIHTI